MAEFQVLLRLNRHESTNHEAMPSYKLNDIILRREEFKIKIDIDISAKCFLGKFTLQVPSSAAVSPGEPGAG